MATVVDSVSIVGLRPVHFDQLIHYLDVRDHDSWYYGNKEQFEKRHQELREWLNSILDRIDDPSVRIPKKDKA